MLSHCIDHHFFNLVVACCHCTSLTLHICVSPSGDVIQVNCCCTYQLLWISIFLSIDLTRLESHGPLVFECKLVRAFAAVCLSGAQQLGMALVAGSYERFLFGFEVVPEAAGEASPGPGTLQAPSWTRAAHKVRCRLAPQGLRGTFCGTR